MHRFAMGQVCHYQPELTVLHRVLDSSCVGATLWVCNWLHGVPWRGSYPLAAITAMLLFYLCAEIGNLYRPGCGHSLWQDSLGIFVVWLGAVFGLMLVGYTTQTLDEYSLLVIGAWFAATPLVLALSRLLVRLALRALRSCGYNATTVAIVGAGELGHNVARAILAAPWTGLRLLGIYDDQHAKGERPLCDDVAPVRGDLPSLVDLGRKGDVDRVYITLPMRAEQRIKDLLDALADTTVSVYLVPDLFRFNPLHSRWTSLGGIPTLSIFETPFYGVGGWLKRLTDLALTGIILPCIALPMLLIGIGVKVSSAGPILFKQRRYGLDGREVKVWKFRTMTVMEDGEDLVQAREADPRLTRFGAFLRQTSLDELPQFINVLQGHMSIVGPRPHAIAHNEEYRRLIPGYMLRHKVKPGITGWAQVNGWRGQTEVLRKMEQRVKHDLWYIQNWSLWLDIKIILRTIYGELDDLISLTTRGSVTQTGNSPGPSVLLLVENLPVPLDRRVWLEAKSLRDRGYRVSVVCPKMHGHTKEHERLEGIDIFRFPLLYESSGLMGYLLEYPLALTLMFGYALRAWLKSGIDVVHIANPPDLLGFVALPFKLLGKRMIFDQHDLCPELYLAKGKGKGALYRLLLLLERVSYGLADAVLVPNHSYRRIALERGKRLEESVFVVRNGAPEHALAPREIKASQPLVGYLGVMGDQDSVDVVLEVAARLRERYPYLGYVLLGDGTRRAHYEQYAHELGVADRVRFTGMVDENRIAEELSPCLVCLAPDKVNEFTARSTMNKVMDYMALEKPIVQFDTPEGRYSARDAALYAVPNDIDDFAKRIVELLEDPNRAKQMGKDGRRRFLERLHWEHSVKALYEAYDYVLGPAQPLASDPTGPK